MAVPADSSFVVESLRVVCRFTATSTATCNGLSGVFSNLWCPCVGRDVCGDYTCRTKHKVYNWSVRRNAMSVLDEKRFHDEKAAYEWVEAHVWPDGRICPHCGTVGDSAPLQGKSTRIGVYKCYSCRKPFTVKVGTIFEASHIKLHVWLQAMFLLCGSKKGMSANQLGRTLGVTLKSAWFLAHRIRLAMADDGSSGPLGGDGKVIEADETYMGPREYRFDGDRGEWVGIQGTGGKVRILSLVERGGRVRSIPASGLSPAQVNMHILKNTSLKSRLHTDEAATLKRVGKQFAKHE